ncbi:MULTISPECIES: thioredoxin family protein [unclassified Cellulophaga]|uniref:thioredoxin family protein n=1 Tax=unclassified Cellulophaga TaxID=2634405 RepID=UPI000C2C966F|nr:MULTISPECIES: thioredoxin family protein [unclassified Cellulophaga]MDO6493024.1 thioredoxin family protein [Cellulophaga sp. 2_MG-2023]MDO6496000.1 thioredoxin family protein [Cellulophaga sp. 3_MG-2023]PKB43585.1 thioredoxin-related protein [Cellulophaga sp. RHA19]
MKNLILVFSLLFSGIITAQEWSTSFSDAVKKAKEEQKQVLLVFSGSDWCAPCIKLDTEIWKSSEFKKYAEEHLVLYRADFPRKKKNRLAKDIELANKELADTYNQQGFFPLVLLLDADKNILGKTGYKNVSPLKYIAHLTTFVK